MAVAKIKVTFPCDVKKVWDVVTCLEEYGWRSDLSRIEVITPKQFVEYTKEGYATTFTITAMELYKRWVFSMENDNMRGLWTGLFSQSGGNTTIVFTEDVTAKKIWMRPFVGLYLRKQQAAYVHDLERALGLKI